MSDFYRQLSYENSWKIIVLTITFTIFWYYILPPSKHFNRIKYELTGKLIAQNIQIPKYSFYLLSTSLLVSIISYQYYWLLLLHTMTILESDYYYTMDIPYYYFFLPKNPYYKAVNSYRNSRKLIGIFFLLWCLLIGNFTFRLIPMSSIPIGCLGSPIPHNVGVGK